MEVTHGLTVEQVKQLVTSLEESKRQAQERLKEWQDSAELGIGRLNNIAACRAEVGAHHLALKRIELAIDDPIMPQSGPLWPDVRHALYTGKSLAVVEHVNTDRLSEIVLAAGTFDMDDSEFDQKQLNVVTQKKRS